MATLTEIINNKDAKADAKLEAINDIVTNIRAKYGNTDVIVDTPEVNTTDGVVGLQYLSDEDKVAVAANVIADIRIIAIEDTKQSELIKLDKRIEELVATSNILVTLSAKSESEYI